MRWCSAVSTAPRLTDALDELEHELSHLGASPDFLCGFLSAHFRDSYEEFPERLRARFAPRAMLGCSAAGVIGGGREVEQQPAISITAALLPEVTITRFHVETEQLPTPDDGPGAWWQLLGVQAQPTPHFLILSDPHTCDPTRLLEGLDYAYVESAKVGGLASDGVGNILFLDDAVHRSGTVGVALSGNVVVDPIVAQGCRPIGQRHVITRCRQNLLLELDGRKPTDVLAEIYLGLSSADQSLLQHSLHLGVASTGLVEDSQPRDYLIRNVLGADPRHGALAIGASLRPGQSVRFHLRDSQTADDDLSQTLSRYQARDAQTSPAGALLFSCTGRGEHLYGHPNHDSNAFRDRLQGVPLGGFFCAGEIGPIGSSTHLMGYTSSFGVFRPRD